MASFVLRPVKCGSCPQQAVWLNISKGSAAHNVGVTVKCRLRWDHAYESSILGYLKSAQSFRVHESFLLIAVQRFVREHYRFTPSQLLQPTTHSTVTDLAKFLGLSTSVPRAVAV